MTKDLINSAQQTFLIRFVPVLLKHNHQFVMPFAPGASRSLEPATKRKANKFNEHLAHSFALNFESSNFVGIMPAALQYWSSKNMLIARVLIAKRLITSGFTRHRQQLW